MGVVIYWAAPLFTQAERLWNRLCADDLRKRGFTVVLPQDEAASHFKDGVLDIGEVAEDCYRQAISADVMIAVLDGADSDSGTSVEVGLRIGRGRAVGSLTRILGVRTDFRASEDGGLNGMFRLIDEILYFPSLNEDYVALCAEIQKRIANAIDIS